MQHIAIVYHSAHGHTAHIAHRVLDGARAVPGVLAELVRAEDLAQAGWMLHGRQPARVLIENPAERELLCRVAGVPVLHLAELAAA